MNYMKISNRKAFFEYFILDEYVAGVVLVGSEVKSIRQGDANINESYVFINNDEIWIKNMYISKYKQANTIEKNDENRDRKLLLNKKEIQKIQKSLQDNGITIIPLEVFLLNNKVKIKIGIAKGKKLYDKRETIKKRDVDRELKRI
jgi:SsrA-binding protein